MEGKLYVISAPSGCGKTTLVNTMLKSFQDICLSISHTTRRPRLREKQGVHYYFVSIECFKNLIKAKAFIEYAIVFDHYYGTSLRWMTKTLQRGKDVILEIDWQGARQIKKYFPQAVTIFLIPPSLQSLKMRLSKRAQDSQLIIAERMKQAQRDLSHYSEYDYLVLNKHFKSAAKDLSMIINAHRLQRSIQSQRLISIIDTLLCN